MHVLLIVFILPLATGGVLPSYEDDGFDQLIDQVKHIAASIRRDSTPADVVGPVAHTKAENTTREGPHIPGWNNNICVNLCPKWCKKSPGNQTIYTHCHYVCGNICHKQTREVNMFMGDPTYEVVPSSFTFANYDSNHDKKLSIIEIARTDGVQPDDIRRLFQFADFNYDGYLDYDEFQGGPFVFTVQMAAELTAVAKSTSNQTEESD